MGSNCDGISSALRRWSTGLSCAAGLLAGQHLWAAEPADGVLTQYQAAMHSVSADSPADSAEPASAATDADAAAQAREVPLISARLISPAGRSSPSSSGRELNVGRDEAGLAPVVTPAQARQNRSPQAKDRAPSATRPVRAIQPDRIGRTVNPSTAGLPALPAQQLPKIRQAQQDPQPMRVELGKAASPVVSVPLIESSQASSVPAPAGAPMMLENPLVGGPEPQVPEAAPVKTESLAPVVQRASLQPNVIPATGAHAIQRAQFAGSGDNSLDESQAIQIQKHSLPGEQEYASPSPAASRTISAAAMQPVEPPAQPAVLQPLPGGEEFGQLPEGSPFETIGESGTIKLRVRRSMLLRTKVDVYRTATVDEAVVELVQFTPREISLIGRSQGQTHITFWFNDPAQPPVTYLVEVSPDAQAIKVEEEKYKLLENVINEMFPDSKVYLVLVADKLLVKGQARDSEEAAQIMTIIRAQGGNLRGGFGGLTEGVATPVLSLAATGNAPGPGYTIINMLRVPGVQQVALKVKIAELNRSAARGFGVNVAGAVDIGNNGDELIFASILNGITGGGTSVIASLDGGDLDIGMRYLQQRGVIRLLSEPTLVTLSGRPATFIAGGEFAVPTIVGNVGLNAVTTDFRSFGAIISFVPVIVDKDRIRLQVAPEFSQINNQLSVGGTPGLNVRAATTTVEMREGQTLAIAGLLEDNYNSTTAGDLPFLAQIFGRRSASHNETELIILVTPELVHPMEPEEVPPLPGFDVTEPTAGEFFLAGHIEGNPTRDHRSTVWPRLKRRYGMGGPAMTSGPFGHGQ